MGIDNGHIMRKQLPFYDELTPAQQARLETSARKVYYAPKTRIQLQSEECHGLFIVQKGWVRVFMTSESGREMTLFQLQAGDVCLLTASCMFEDIQFVSGLEAVDATEVLLVPSHVLTQMSANQLAVQHFFLKLSQKRLSEVMWVIDQVVFKSFDQRLAHFLHQQQTLSGSNELVMTHEQIAQQLGSAREVVSRMLKYFEKEGYVKLHRGMIELIKLPND